MEETTATAQPLLDPALMTMFNRMISLPVAASAALSRYTADFMIPYVIAARYFNTVEKDALPAVPPLQAIQDYFELMAFNADLMVRGADGISRATHRYMDRQFSALATALQEAAANGDMAAVVGYLESVVDSYHDVAVAYPEAIDAIGSEFGFHFERGDHEKVDETDRFLLYRVAPTHGASVRKDGKPVLVLPPYVLGANILCFLPGDRKSYVHAFANQGVPTYIRILKDIRSAEALQTMTGEDDARDTRRFCEILKKRHGKPVTLNGYCQGGFSAVCDLLSGELDDLVDALITCVAPMDGTRSKGLSGFLNRLPERFNDLAYGAKALPNGNVVADGKLMGWVYKLKSIDVEAPLTAFFRDTMMLDAARDRNAAVSKTALAINHWLKYERNDLPMAITRMSFDSYNTPITDDGTLPVTLFGKTLNFKRLKARRIPWLICYGEQDDLVEPDTALAPRDYIDVEATAFPKGHVAIATSWSHPDSPYPLDGRFGDDHRRGPVRFHLDLEAALAAPAKKPAAKKPAAKKAAAKKAGRKKPAAAKKKTAGKKG